MRGTPAVRRDAANRRARRSDRLGRAAGAPTPHLDAALAAHAERHRRDGALVVVRGRATRRAMDHRSDRRHAVAPAAMERQRLGTALRRRYGTPRPERRCDRSDGAAVAWIDALRAISRAG